jgi:FtsP/CotA-like multicopper oxidase with cupredoxin domain
MATVDKAAIVWSIAIVAVGVAIAFAGQSGQNLGVDVKPPEALIGPETIETPSYEETKPKTVPFEGKSEEVMEKTKPSLLSKTTPISLSDGDVFDLKASPISKVVNGKSLQMFGYNNQSPGPMLLVNQGDEVTVNFTNEIEFPTTVHWHGLRLDYTSDGVPGITQAPILPGETFEYNLNFPDSGIFLYHPHVRTEMQMEMGLYGNILVEPKDSEIVPTDYQIPLILDDVSISEEGIEFDPEIVTHTLMGRFGNTMLINGDSDYSLQFMQGETARFYLTSTSNTRTFDFAIEQHKIKLLADDASKYEQSKIVYSVIIAPSERRTIDVLFENPGQYKITHTTPSKEYVFGTITVLPSTTTPNNSFYTESENIEIINEIDSFRKYFSIEPELKIEFDVKMMSMETMDSDHNDHSMKMEVDEMAMDEHDMMMSHIEWEDEMPKMNAMSNEENTHWILRDVKTGKEGFDIDFQANVGDVKKIRFFNNPESAHPMQHPIHLHGQRFLVLSEDGILNDNLAWKDTVLVPTGKTIDVLVEFSNPGNWAMHCHILEHAEAGMITEIVVN